MAENMLSARWDFGRTFNTAMWVIGFIAALQVFASGWAVISREPLPASHVEAPIEQPPPQLAPPVGRPQRSATDLPQTGEFIPAAPIASITPPEQVPPSLNPVRENPTSVPLADSIPPPVSRGSILSPPNMTGPAYSKSLGEDLADAASSVAKIEDPLLERQISLGEEFRSSGNMQGALKALHQVEAVYPDHPRVLSELAGTYSQMGLDVKAMSYWERVDKLGSKVAGDYYPLAERALRGEQAAPVGAVTDILKIRDVVINKQPPGKDGQWVTLKVEIQGDPSVAPVGKEMSMIVSFYDMVDGKKIETSTADTSQEFPSPPYDWQDKGVEEIEVIYHQPVFTVEQKRELGERVYHGYVIELYYRDQFQDTAAFPKNLQELRIQEMNENQKNAAKQNALSLKEITPGPENSLFPKAPPAQ